MSGWIKVHRSIFESETFQSLTAEQQAITYRILLEVNHEDGIWFDARRGLKVNIKRGQKVVSRNKIANEWFKHDKSITERKVRTLLLKLEKMNFLTIETTNHYTLVNVVNYDAYQSKEKVSDQGKVQEMSKGSPREVQEMSTNKNVKNLKNVKNNISCMNDFSKLYQRIEQTFGFQSPANNQALEHYLDEGFEIAAVDEAINRTLKKADNPSFKYLKQILNSWSSRKIYLLKDIKIIDPFKSETEFSKPNKQRQSYEVNEFHQRNGVSPPLPEEEVEAYIQELLEIDKKNKQGIYAE